MEYVATLPASAREGELSTVSVQITEIFRSIQGESTWAGWPTAFVRLTGCPVRCVYCDTAYAFQGGRRMTVAQVLDAVDAHGCRYVCVTGGEPMAQPGVRALLAALVERGDYVSLETAGVRALTNLPRPLKLVLDVKTPGSGVYAHWLPETLDALVAGDELKVVVTDAADWRWLVAFYRTHAPRLPKGVAVNVSPVWGGPSAAWLAERILASGLPFRLNMQLHKLVWPDAGPGH